MKYSILKLKRKEKHTLRDLEKLRGFLGEKYIDNVFFHNHLGNDKYVQEYPKLQYKLIKNTLSILTIEDMIEINKQLFEELDYININGDIIFDIEKEIQIINENVEYAGDEMYEYKFVTPYLPLNEKNFKRYLKGEYTMEQAVTNNILEVLKGLGIRLEKEQRILVKTNFEKSNRTLKDIKMVSFGGTFLTNIKFPDYFSIGKRKSLGYGTFVKLKGEGQPKYKEDSQSAI